MAHQISGPDGQPLETNPDLSNARPGQVAIIIESFLDQAHVPLHTRLGAICQLMGNYLWQGLKPPEKGDDA